MTDESPVALTENSGENSGKNENLTPWKPGKSGNPGGRPKRLPITGYIVDQLGMPIPASMKAKLPPIFREVYGDEATFGQMLAFKAIAEAAKGDMRAMKTVLDRTEGKVKQNVALSNDNDNVLKVVFVGGLGR